jgi:acetamidase/formamidase
MQIALPYAETKSHFITMAFDEDLDDAAKEALRQMILLITQRTNLSRAQAYSLCSLAADLRVTQIVNGNKGIHAIIPKSVI